jgi:cyanuric acid amidohydrolase
MSGGTEGVLSPHVTLLSEIDRSNASPGGALGEGDLAAGSSVSAVIPPSDLGRAQQVEAVAATVRAACVAGGFPADHAVLVLVKCPLLTSAAIQQHRGTVVTEDTYESMAASRAASALGVARGTGEISADDCSAALRGDRSYWSVRASASAGAEVDRCHVLALGRSPAGGGVLRAESVVMSDACDIDPLLEVRDRIAAAGGAVVQVFAKAEASPDGMIRGRRHTMLNDSDLHSTRHARAAVGGLIAGVFGLSTIYVSGGAEFQGPPGGGPVTIVWSPRSPH